MDAIDLLTEQHQDVQDLFEQIEQTDDDDEKDALFQELADSLAAHATIEEQIFYPVAYAAYGDKTQERLTEAVDEHLAMKRIIADLLVMMPEEENFDALIRVLQEQVEHHVEEEEDDLFEACRRKLGADQLNRLGEQMKKLFDELMDGEPSGAVPEQTSEGTPLR